MPRKNIAIRIFDWFSQTVSPRFTLDLDDWLSVFRAVIMASASAGLAEISRLLAQEAAHIEVNRLVAYVVAAAVLQILRKWAGSYS